MAEYIEVDQMWKCETCFHHWSGECTLGIFGCDHGESYRPAYNKLKKADVVPVVHGRWEIKTDDYDCEYAKCSVCGEEFYDANEDTIDITFNYCPNCGARMDGDG